MIANKNVDKSENYVLLKSDVTVKVKTRKGDALENAVDKATNTIPGGVYLQNATIWVSPSGRKLKINGDVYGVKSTELPKENTMTDWKVGDKVQYKTPFGRKTGEIIDISDPSEATVKLDDGKSEKVKYKYLMKN